ncbi:MAG: 3-oxoacyl-ACP reductase FabG [Clostridia bacterium]|nr:3-oxoacyl-ACP reductase FabG [Clostridia bacterium]
MKTILITGASGAIGGAIAKAFQKDDCRLILLANRNPGALAEVADELQKQGREVHCRACDLSSREDIAALCRSLKKEFGGVDVLINNAGIALAQKLITDCTPEEWDKLFAVDVRSIFLLCRELLPEMISNRRGSIVNIASIWGGVGGSCEVPYTAAKAAVIGFTKALAREVGPSGVRVNCVAPGFVKTPMNDHLNPEEQQSFFEETPLSRAAEPKEVAASVRFLALEEASFITGQVLTVDGGYSA